MRGTSNLVVYHNNEIIRNTHEGVRFVCQNLFSFVVPCTMTLIELQNGLCQSMENVYTMLIIDEASMQNMFQIHRQTQMRQPHIELAVVYEGMNSDSKEDFKATYETGDKDEDGDVGVEVAAENVVVHPSSSQPMYVPPFMRELDLDAMHAPEFPKYVNIST
ncbi:hypothetical protein AHAS_Ahas02G0211900 [Arachis hypogaea]